MRQVCRWIVILLLLGAPAVGDAQGSGGTVPQVRAPDSGSVSISETERLALSRRGTERLQWGQHVVLVMLAVLLAAALIFGIFTLAHVFRERPHAPQH